MGNSTSTSNEKFCKPVNIENTCTLTEQHLGDMCNSDLGSNEDYIFSYYQSQIKDVQDEKNGIVQNIDVNISCKVDNKIASQLCKLKKTDATTKANVNDKANEDKK